jgi:NDP-sugar pyrophosphorylase family protein
MLSIAGKPILEHNVRLLVRYGIREIVINLHHQPEVIEQHFADGSAFGARITYSREKVLLGTGGALDALRGSLSEDYFVIYGDNLSTCRLDRLRAVHREQNAALTMAVFQREDVLTSGIVGFAEDGRINRFLEKPGPSAIFSNWVNAGILVCGSRLLDLVPRGAKSDLSQDILPKMLERGDALYAYKMREHLWWIDSIEDYKRTLGDPMIARLLAESEATTTANQDLALSEERGEA